jgi:hypothetical protein
MAHYQNVMMKLIQVSGLGVRYAQGNGFIPEEKKFFP